MDSDDDPDNPHRWLYDPVSPGFAQWHEIEEVFWSGKTAFQQVEILFTRSFGRCLVLDGKIQSSERDEFVYHEALVHSALVHHTQPQRIFIAGGGEGATLREVLSYSSVEKVVMVDIDKEAVDICRRFLPAWHQGAFEDPRVEVLHLDARKYLSECEDKFDVVIIDVTDPMEMGPSYLLYTNEFYQLVLQKLTPGGILSVQVESFVWTENPIFPAVCNTLRSTFPSILPYQTYIPSFGGMWGFALASSELPSLSVKEVDNRISSRVTRNLKFYDGTTHQGMLSLPKNLRQAISEESRIITDTDPQFIARYQSSLQA